MNLDLSVTKDFTFKASVQTVIFNLLQITRPVLSTWQSIQQRVKQDLTCLRTHSVLLLTTVSQLPIPQQ